MQSEQPTMVRDAVVFLASAVVCVPFFRKLALGSILGYLAAGALIGPWVLKLIQNTESIMHFAELGVVFLLFLIGLELKPSRLWALKHTVFGLGGMQVGITAVLLAIAMMFIADTSFQSALLLGLSMSLSSTAFTLQLLSERSELKTETGRSAFAILLFQDLAVIPLLALIPLWGPSSASMSTSEFLSRGALALGAVGAVFGMGKYLVRPFFRYVAESHAREVFAAASLLVVLGVSWLIASVGISMALGAFLAGVVLSDSEYRHELEANIESFKGLLLGLFFIAVGMSVDFGLLVSKPLLVGLWLVALITIKFFVLWGIGRYRKFSPCIAARFAGSLAQGGEFAFVIATIAVSQSLITTEVANLLTLSVTLSMALTPALMYLLDLMVQKESNVALPAFDIPDEHAPVIVAGFGRVGQIVARLLRMRNIPFTALEQDYAQVEVVRRFGNKIYFGDASRVDLLEAAKAHEAKYFFLCIDDIDASLRAAEAVLKHFPNLKIIARARNRNHVFLLRDLGVTSIFRETWSSSIEMALAGLSDMGFAEEELQDLKKKFKEFDENMLVEQHKVYRDETAMISVSQQAAGQLARVMQQDENLRKKSQ